MARTVCACSLGAAGCAGAPQASLRHAVTLWLGSLHGACRRARAQQAGQAGWRAQRSCMHLKLVENQDKRTVHSAKK